MLNTKVRVTILVVLAASSVARAQSAEICGNGLDDNSNNMTDEGCYNLTSGQCESPLSCGDTGSVSPKKGSLRYLLPPDVAPKVPFGPGIGFRRAYLSQYSPESGAPAWKKPLGDRWHHTYMTWITKTGTYPSSTLVLHTSQGQDIRAASPTTVGTWQRYVPQVGAHYQFIQQRNEAPFEYQVRLLTGETLVYNLAGRLIEVWDTLATPNKVTLTYDGNGQVATVTDASTYKRLNFVYDSSRGLLTDVQYQTSDLVGSWTTRNTTTFDYNVGVSMDVTSKRFVPASATEWTTLLQGSGIANPGSTWLMQETSGAPADSIGTRTGTIVGSVTHQVSATGWTRKGIKVTTDHSTSHIQVPTPTASTTSLMFAQWYSINTIPPMGPRALNRLGSTQAEDALLINGPKIRAQSGFSTSSDSSTFSGTILIVTKLDHSRNELVVYTDQGDVLKPTFLNQSADTSSSLLGNGFISSDATLLYGALFTGTAAELSDAQVATLIKRMKTGPGLSKVTIGGEAAQLYVYNSSGDLNQINDSNGNALMGFGFSSTTAGQINRIETPRGVVGFEFNSARSSCSGQTVLYFNKGNTTSCSVDSDCGSGFLCGGKTGTGSTGACFRAARCMTVSSPSEDVVTTVTPLGPPGENCDGVCSEVSEYVWNTGPIGAPPALDLQATKDAANLSITRKFNSNGLVTKMTFGDQDTDPDNGNSSRVVEYFYDVNFPGKVIEIRRKSDLSPFASSCSVSGTITGCALTLYNYNSNGLLSSISHLGTTLGWNGSTASTVDYGLMTSFSYDSKGRLTQIDGPLSGSNDVTAFEYWTSSGDSFKEGYLQNYKRKKDTTNFIVTSALAYDFWGNATTLRGADTDATHSSGTVTCLTFSNLRGHLTQRREAMNGQTDCSTSNSADITTSWTRDKALRLTQITRPDGSCVFYEYDAKGRLFRTKRRDDCNAASAGDTQELVYDHDSLVTDIFTDDSNGSMTHQQQFAYFDSRRLQKIINPVDTSKWTGLVYDSRGNLNQVDSMGGLGKTVFNRSTSTAAGRESRVTSVDMYKTSSTFDTWNLLFSWLGDQLEVTDGDSKTTQTVRDDLGRTVKLVSPDMSYPIAFIFDAGGRLVTKIDALGGGSAQQVHSFTYDNMNRLLNADYAGACPTGTAQAEIQHIYDAAPRTCPVTGGCQRLGGRLAYVKATLFCSSAFSATDGAWDQETFYSYDDAGRMIREDIVYDGTLSGPSSNSAWQSSTWTKLSQLQYYIGPANVSIGANYNSTASNSDADRVDYIWRVNNSSAVAQNVKWFPFGPLKQYDQLNKVSNKTQRTVISRNLAYRITSVSMEPYNASSTNFKTTVTEDAKGRVTSRVYTGGASGMQNSYFLYDDQDRLLCETTSSVSSCPTSGSNIKNSHEAPFYTAAGDRLKLLRPIPGSTGILNSFNPSGYGSSHQITSVSQPNGTPTLGTTEYTYDARGNRSSDDNTSTLTHDRRDYTYDGRGNLVNVRGEFWTGSAWRYYDVGSAFDHKNRRVFKFFLDNTSGVRTDWWFYYDALDRLVEVWHVPNAASSSTYTLFHLSWLEDRLVSYAQTDYPSGTVSKRYVNTDESGRPIDMWSWPSSGNASRVWAINPDAWGLDANLAGASMYQPVLFAGQYQDAETVAMQDSGTTRHRSGLVANGFRTFDPFAGAYMQVDRIADTSWSNYVYAASDPVGSADPTGLAECPLPCDNLEQVEIGGGVNGCGLLCTGACWAGVGWAFGCACSECGGGGGGIAPTDMCAPPCFTDFDGTIGEKGACVCPPDEHIPGCKIPRDITPPWLTVGDMRCLITGPADNGKITVYPPHPTTGKRGIFGFPNVGANVRSCISADSGASGGVTCFECLDGCQATYSDAVRSCAGFLTAKGCERCLEVERGERATCVEACKQTFCSSGLPSGSTKWM